jgi:hypothetical protein
MMLRNRVLCLGFGVIAVRGKLKSFWEYLILNVFYLRMAY